MRVFPLILSILSLVSSVVSFGCSGEQETSSFDPDSSPVPLTAPVPDEPLSVPSRSLLAITAPVMFDTAEADGILNAMSIFPPDNPWNQDISGAPVRSNSKSIIASIGAKKSLRFNLDMNFILVPTQQPKIPVKVKVYPDESDPGPFAVPKNAPIEHWPITGDPPLPFPGETLDQFQREGRGDRHLIIVTPGTGRLDEFWQARKTNAGWEASQASTWNLNSNARRPEGWTSADAAGLPIFPAIVRYHEVASGMVRHAMRFTVNNPRNTYVYPASHRIGDSTGSNLPRMGERLRLRASFDTSGFPPHAQAILKGLKKYGMFVADRGGDWLMSISPDKRIKGLDSLSDVHGEDFEVVDAAGSKD